MKHLITIIYLSLISLAVEAQNLKKNIDGDWDYSGQHVRVIQRKGSDSISFSIDTEGGDIRKLNFKGVYNSEQLYAEALGQFQEYYRGSYRNFYFKFKLVADLVHHNILTGQIEAVEMSYNDEYGNYQVVTKFDPIMGPIFESMEFFPFEMEFNGYYETDRDNRPTPDVLLPEPIRRDPPRPDPVIPEPVRPTRPSITPDVRYTNNNTLLELFITNNYNIPIVCSAELTGFHRSGHYQTVYLRNTVIYPGRFYRLYVTANIFNPFVNVNVNSSCRW